MFYPLLFQKGNLVRLVKLLGGVCAKSRPLKSPVTVQRSSGIQTTRALSHLQDKEPYFGIVGKFILSLVPETLLLHFKNLSQYVLFGNIRIFE